jgi:hypothetical protein
MGDPLVEPSTRSAPVGEEREVNDQICNSTNDYVDRKPLLPTATVVTALPGH